MRKFEQHLQQRFPHWFRGRRATLARPLLRAIGRWSKFDAIAGHLEASGHLRDFDFVQATLEFLQARYLVDPAELRRIPASGRLLIVANHPSGALDALALLDAVGQVRRDVKIIANDLLTALQPLSGVLLPIKILGGKPSADSLRAVDAALEQEQCVIVFPAGEVARLGLRGVTDGRWRRGFLRFARATDTPVLPVRIEARNSALFYGASAIFKPAGTALLAREMFARRARRIALHIGHPFQLPAVGQPSELLRQVRRELHAIGTKYERPAPVGPEPLIDAIDPALVRAGVEAMASLGQTFDGKQIRVGQLPAGSPLLREIGRLRELTFRAVGEGTGQRLDVDLYDSWYEHIVLWDDAAVEDRRCVSAGTRLARAARAWPGRVLHRIAVPLPRRRLAAHRTGHGTGAQLRRARVLGQSQHRLPVAGHRRLPAAASGGALPVRPGLDQRCIARRSARADRRLLRPLFRHAGAVCRVEATLRLPRRAAAVRRQTSMRRLRFAC